MSEATRQTEAGDSTEEGQPVCKRPRFDGSARTDGLASTSAGAAHTARRIHVLARVAKCLAKYPAQKGGSGDAGTYADLYVCRHGTTTWNLAKRWQGETDTELAEVGIEQARATADILAERLQHVRCILTSDLKRARATAEIYAARFGCEIVVDPGLREMSLGTFEGMTQDRIYTEHADVFARLSKLGQHDRLRAAYFDGLETPLDTSLRAEAAARRAVELPGSGGAVLLVTHSKVLEAVLARVFDKYYEGVLTKPCAFFHWRYSIEAPAEGDVQGGGHLHQLGHLHDIKLHDKLVEQ